MPGKACAPLGLALLWVLLPTVCPAQDPGWYVRQETWHGTMRASLEAIEAQLGAGGSHEFQPLVSDVMRGGDPARHVKLSVRGVRQLSLIARGVPDYDSAHADWGDAKLIAADGTVTYLSDLEPTAIIQPYGTPRFDQSHRGGPIRIGIKRFERGLGTHAPTELRFALDGEYEQFEVWIGIDLTAGTQGHVRFTITNLAGDQLAALREELWKLVERDFPNRT